MKLSEKQLQVFNAIQSFLDQRGYPPTIREICSMIGLKSPSTVHGHLEGLKKHGLVEWEPEKTRTLKIAR